MIELQKAIFLKLSGDDTLLNILGLEPTQESEISKRLTPTPPSQLSADNQPIIHFRFPQSYQSFRSKLMEWRPIQFRVWSDDQSLVIQQRITERIAAIFVGKVLSIDNCPQYSRCYYVGESQLGIVNDLFGFAVELKIATRVKYFNDEGS